MRHPAAEPSTQAHEGASNPLSRRKLFAGASGLGVIAAAAALIPGAATQSPDVSTVKPAPLKGGGYTLSEHVKQYYKSALI